MYCRSCGKEIKEGKNFCVYCGTPVSKAAMPAQPAGNTAKQPEKTVQPVKQQAKPAVKPAAKQTAAPVKQTAAPKSKKAAAAKKAKKKGHAGLIVVLCLVAVLIAGGVFAFLHFFPFTGKGNTDSKDGTATAAGALNAFESACRDAAGAEVLALLADHEEEAVSGEDPDSEAADDDETSYSTFTMDDLYEEFGEDFVNEALGVTSEQAEAEAEETGDSEEADFMESGSLLSAMLEHSEVTVEAGEENDVTMSLTVPDLYTYLTETNCLEKCETSEDTYNALLELLDSGELGTKDYEFETVMTETDDGWRLVCTSDMLDGFYGGLLTYYAELYVSSYYAAFQYIAEGGTSK